ASPAATSASPAATSASPAATSASPAATAVSAPKATAVHPIVNVSASNWKFAPATITLHVGQTTRLRLTSTQGVHGIQSQDLGIPLTPMESGKFVTLNVTPKKAGRYVLHCAIVCGPGHERMALTVIVTN
ncbi:MAG: cupredoxin domain-containing protein, partial [Candidatus Eremiobacteraeota bacterium]|nr:cupredoxin domain-containing protein [Candidatus Eremiobacteraeota bacterium]